MSCMSPTNRLSHILEQDAHFFFFINLAVHAPCLLYRVEAVRPLATSGRRDHPNPFLGIVKVHQKAEDVPRARPPQWGSSLALILLPYFE